MNLLLKSLLKITGFRSSRTDADLLRKLCTKLSYEPIVFDAVDASGTRFYHTNVMMWIGTEVAAICLQSITDQQVKNISI